MLIVNSWHIPTYMKAARKWRGRALRVVVMDHQWINSPKQWLGRLTRQLFIQPAFDAAFMPGDEQAVFARHLGFKQHEIIVGLYTCDDPFFTGPQDPPQDSFLFTGRLVATKGVDVLAEAYRRYRAERRRTRGRSRSPASARWTRSSRRSTASSCWASSRPRTCPR